MQTAYFDPAAPSKPPAAWAEWNQYFGVNPIHTRGKRATAKDVAAVNCLFADFDAKDHVTRGELAPFRPPDYDALDARAQRDADKAAQVAAMVADLPTYKARALATVDACPLRPTWIVDTGGGYQCYWLLRDTLPIDDANRAQWEALQAAWVELVGADPAAKDLPRVLRMIGSANVKRHFTRPPIVTVVERDDSRLYTPADFELLTGVDDAYMAAKAAKPKPREGGTDDVIARYNAAVRVGDLLTRNGYTPGQARGRMERYSRPGANEPSQTSVIVWTDANRSYHHSSRDDLYCGDAGGGGHSRDAFDVLTHLEHGGDTGAAYVAAKKDLGMWEDAPRPKRATAYTNGTGPHQGGDDAPDFPPERYADTEMGNARRMHDRMGGKLFYVPQFQKWYTWAGTHWAEDKTFRVLDMAKQTVLSMYAELADCTDDAERKRRLAWIRQSESRNRLENMIALLRSEPGIAVLPDTLDQHPMLLPCRNGTLDLTTGQLLPPDPAHHLTQRIDIDYDPAATCPQWERFLDRIMGGNGELIGFVQRLIGHALTGDVSGKYLVFLYGPSGNNGKSTMVETIMRLLGPFALKSPTEMVMAKGYRGGGIPNDIARLRGVRFTVTNEVDAGMTLSESIVKDLTGGDTLTARFMRAEYFDFRPSHKLWMVGNHRPEIRGTDAAIWDRVKLIPFTVEIPKAERDKQLPAKLAAELPGILRWAVDGCLAWQRDGLNAPDLVTHAVADYREEQDVLGQFIGECCDVGPAYTATAGTLYQAYEAWTKQNGGAPLSGNKFGGDMERRGYPAARVGGIRARRGVQLNAYGRGLLPTRQTFHTDDERP
jgi:putative DNA primase/helicase